MNNNFATRIKGLRLSLKATQNAFAEKIGTTQAALSAYEQGDRMPSVEILTSISAAFDVSVDWLLGLSDIKNIDNKPETMGDILKMLFKIGKHCNLDFFEHVEEFEDIDPTTGYPDSYQRTVHEIVFTNYELNSFIGEWHKMYNLFKDGTIDEEVYALWIEKTIRKANNYTPKGYKYLDSLPDDNMPF